MSRESFFDDIEITDAFFEPLIPIPEDMWRSKLFLKIWIRHMSRYPRASNFYDWRPLLVHTLMPCNGKDALYASQIASSFIAWLGRNNGFSFAAELFKKLEQKDRLDSDYRNLKKALSYWSYENSLSYSQQIGGGRTLHRILGYRPSDDTLTAIHFDTVEKIIMWLASKEGMQYLAEAFLKSDRILLRQHKKQLRKNQ